uniref:Uncharacterized protein n=1 Tax=Arundo donax TaxID=35708 RepID=A0A0A9EMA4_ARUDO
MVRRFCLLRHYIVNLALVYLIICWNKSIYDHSTILTVLLTQF